MSDNEVSFSGIAPGHVPNTAKVRRVVVGVRRPFQIRNMYIPVFSQGSQLKVVLNGLGLTFQMFGQCLIAFFFALSLGTGLLSRTLCLPGQGGGAVIILQDDQVQGGVPFAVLGLQLICPVGEGFIIRWIGGRMFSPDLFLIF